MISGNPTFAPGDYSSKILDKSTQNIYYDYTYVKNPEEKSEKKSSLVVLQIGENFSKFSDIYRIKLDSVKELHSHLKSIGKKEINAQLNYRNSIAFKPTVIRDLKNSSLVFQSRIPSNDYEYEIEHPSLNWVLEPDYKTILGYKVQKATVIYSGRKWIGWFTESIPIHLGPYVFGNLPGLIVELYDEQNNFHFIAKGLNSHQEIIYKRNEKQIIKTTQSKFLKTEKNYHERPSLFLKSSTGAGEEIKKIPYNPIELAN